MEAVLVLQEYLTHEELPPPLDHFRTLVQAYCAGLPRP